MQAITAQPTGAEYAAATTIEGDDWEGLYVITYNATVVMQVRDMPGGHYQQGAWGAELKVAPSAFPIDRCSGVRFRTNPATPSAPGIVNAWAWKEGEARIGSGVQITGSQSASGAITAGQMITGLVDSTGVVLAGSGFTAVRTGAGAYTVTFTTPFANPPVVVAMTVTARQSLGATAVSASAFSLDTQTDNAFNFIAAAII